MQKDVVAIKQYDKDIFIFTKQQYATIEWEQR